MTQVVPNDPTSIDPHSFEPGPFDTGSSARSSDRHTPLGLTRYDLLAIYRTMVLARRLDERVWALNRQGRAPFVVSCQGHEATQVAAAWALQPGHDIVVPYYRDTALALTLGVTATEVLLGVLCKATDPSSGARQMPHHYSSRRLGILSNSSCIATQIPHAAGAALAAKLRSESRVAVTTFGDGATSEGDFHETMNMAGLHRLPMVFVCENNGYAISTPVAEQVASADIANYAQVYGFPGLVVDGNDALDVYGCMRAAVARARRGDGPTLLECKTYRYLPHTSEDDDRSYRSSEEVDEWRAHDPIELLRTYLVERDILSDENAAEVDSSVRSEVDAALVEAEAAAAPEPGDAFRRVFAKPIAPLPGVPAEHMFTQTGFAGIAAEGEPTTEDGATEVSLVEAVRATLEHALANDDRVILLGEDIGRKGGVFRATEGLTEQFGTQRVIDTPLAESLIVGMAIGAATEGLRPVVEIQFGDFIHPAFDQLVSEASRMYYRSNGEYSVPLVVRAPNGGGVHGGLYHSQSIESWLAHVPGLKVVCPSTPSDLKGLLLEAIDDPDPVIVLEPKRAYRSVRGLLPIGDWRVPIGKASVARPGDDITIITYGMMRHYSCEAAERLSRAGEGEVEVIDLRTITPLDRPGILDAARRTGRVLVVSEDTMSVSVASEVCALIAEEAFWDLDVPVRRLCTADVPATPFAGVLEQALLPDVDRIEAAARSLLTA